MQPASIPSSPSIESTKTLNYLIPLPIVSDSEDSKDEDQGRNTLLRTVQCKTTKMSLVKEVKDINSS